MKQAEYTELNSRRPKFFDDYPFNIKVTGCLFVCLCVAKNLANC